MPGTITIRLVIMRERTSSILFSCNKSGTSRTKVCNKPKLNTTIENLPITVKKGNNAIASFDKYLVYTTMDIIPNIFKITFEDTKYAKSFRLLLIQFLL